MADALRQIVDRYRSILAERNVAMLLGAGVASELGDWFNTVALISLSFHFTDSALGVGGMFEIWNPRLALESGDADLRELAAYRLEERGVSA